VKENGGEYDDVQGSYGNSRSGRYSGVKFYVTDAPRKPKLVDLPNDNSNIDNFM
jgi:hypothetical protein